MIAKKARVETTVYTTFTVPLAELLEAYIPKEEREKPLCSWWLNSSGDAHSTVEFVRLERVAVGYDAEGRELLEAERETAHNDP
jgi:hypothetical protein